jgi:hypothetical protein
LLREERWPGWEWGCLGLCLALCRAQLLTLPRVILSAIQWKAGVGD